MKQFEHGLYNGRPLGAMRPTIINPEFHPDRRVEMQMNDEGDESTLLDYMSSNTWSYVIIALAGLVIVGVVTLTMHWFGGLF